MMREPAERPEATGDRLVGSCDGAMVNTRVNGWRELKA